METWEKIKLSQPELPFLALTANPSTHIHVAYKSTKGTLSSFTIPLTPGWAPASKQMAEWTAIQMQTSDCSWQSLVGLQVTFICLHESSKSLFSLSCLNRHLPINYSRLQLKFQVWTLVAVCAVHYCDLNLIDKETHLPVDLLNMTLGIQLWVIFDLGSWWVLYQMLLLGIKCSFMSDVHDLSSCLML